MTGDTEELELLRDSIARLLERAGGVGRARIAREKAEIDTAVWKELAEAGILGVMATEPSGGMELGLAAGGVIAIEMGRVLAPEPFTATTCLAIPLLEELGAGSEQAGAIVGGEAIAGIALQERGAGGVSETLETRFSNGCLDGAKSWAVNCEDADILLVLAQGPNGQTLCLVDAGAKGMKQQSVRQSDGGLLSDISFSSTPATELASGPRVAEAITAATDRATALIACELLGVSGAALEITLEFLKTREQFGKKIGSFQAIQHRAVDMHTALQVADAGIRECLTLMDKVPDAMTRSRHASRAKVRACEVAMKITRESIQMHGAVGYTDEFDIGLYLNRALALSAWLGNAAYHRQRWFRLAGIQEQ